MPRCNDGSWCVEDYCNHANAGEQWCHGEQRVLPEDYRVDGPFSADARPEDVERDLVSRKETDDGQ